MMNTTMIRSIGVSSIPVRTSGVRKNVKEPIAVVGLPYQNQLAFCIIPDTLLQMDLPDQMLVTPITGSRSGVDILKSARLIIIPDSVIRWSMLASAMNTAIGKKKDFVLELILHDDTRSIMTIKKRQRTPLGGTLI